MTRYTPGQLRDAVDITAETYRHWRKVVSPLRHDKGHSPCFTPGDLLATLVIKGLTIDLGLKVSGLSRYASDIFKICNASPWPTLERGILVIEPANGKCGLHASIQPLNGDSVFLMVPLGPLVVRLRGVLLADHEQLVQGTLQFPPVAQPTPRSRKVTPR